MAAVIATGGVRMVLGWLRFGHGQFDPEAAEGREELWRVYVEDEVEARRDETGVALGGKCQSWCGAWLWSKSCKFGNQCGHAHPPLQLKLCDASVPHIDKMPPMQCLALHESTVMGRERIAFVEHEHAGVVWGRVFSVSKNEQLLASFLRSEWAQSHIPLTPQELVVASAIPDACWHRVATAAGMKTTLPLQAALGPCIQWAPWLQQMFSTRAEHQDNEVLDAQDNNSNFNNSSTALESPLGQTEISMAGYPTSEQTSNISAAPGRSQCLECRHWRGVDKHERCGGCQSSLCQHCVRIHICRCTADFSEINASLHSERLGSLVGAAADCAAVARAIASTNILQVLSGSRGPSAPGVPAGVSVVCGLVARCGEERVPLRPVRTLDCGAEVLCARFSGALLAVRTATQLRVFRREDWKTLSSLPAPPGKNVQHYVTELLEDTSLLISTAPKGLSVLNLEDGESTLVKTEGDEWQLHATERPQLLAAHASSLVLRDLGKPNLPVISTWQCSPLGLVSSGAIAVASKANSTSADRRDLLWIDPRQQEASILQLDCSAFVKETSRWTAAAVGSNSQGSLAILGTASGDLVAVELRMPKVPLWCISRPHQGPVRKIYLAPRMVLAEFQPFESFAKSRFQVASLQGTPLAVFTGMQAVATGSGSLGQSPNLLACGVGSALTIVGAVPSAACGDAKGEATAKKKTGARFRNPKDHTRRSRPQ
ncbi:unnamed protein product [Polarella glacialis]|uniref:Uncharacterized protein n=1 Tax=Polarella glacialis TaxID=89957 RepID=A0A813EHJ8_POLGL|nr:unnamed protein product [Polarella glacialis]